MISQPTDPSRFLADDLLLRAGSVRRNLSAEELARLCVERDGGELLASGAVSARSGRYTGRSPKDKFVVRDADTEARIWWENNAPMKPGTFARLRDRFAEHAAGRELYVVDAFAGADPGHRIRVRAIVERPYHALFIRQLLIRPGAEELAAFEPDWVVTDFGTLRTDPERDGVRSEATIAISFGRREVLIAGTEYAGEMKKSVFTVMNDLLPDRGVFPMHCSANVGADGVSALFFGLSGTGKTTLSADPERALVGDDEHGWSEGGVFNVEGGCYAKAIHLSPEKEPQIFAAIRAGAILENVPVKGGEPDYHDVSITENTRAAYPLENVAGARLPSVAGHPRHVVFLTADALGVLPPIAKLSKEEAMRFFLAGYTAKVAGTEAGVTEPQVVFSACFAAPFLPRRPREYAAMLGERLERHGVSVWLVNTGWTGGPYGVGRRMDLGATRAMLRAALSGELDGAEFERESAFGLSIPVAVPGVDAAVLRPRGTWSDPAAYDAAASDLRAKFDANAAKFA